jgi:hypothetical protein
MAAMNARPVVTSPPHEVEIAQAVFQVREMSPADEQALLLLHVRVFGPGASHAWYEWKYGQGGGLGMGVWHNGELIAHCGGLPRTLWRQGRRIGGIQIGDVLVAPEWRGILTRRGPFFQACSRFYAAHVGARSGHDIGFGFPNDRAMRLPLLLKIGWDGGPIHSLDWRVAASPEPLAGWAWRWTELDPAHPDFESVIGAAWQRMRAKASDLILGERTAPYVRWRYERRPGRTCSMFALRRPWSRDAVGVAVLDLSSADALWLDWIGEPGAIAVAHRAGLAEAARRGATRLSAWCSPAVVDCLQNSGFEHQNVTARLGIPRASELTEDEVAGMRWWFMGGDTDFL